MNIFNLPPVTVIPCKAGMGSAPSNKNCLNVRAPCEGLTLYDCINPLFAAENNKATAPATVGVAIEVPVLSEYELLKSVDRTEVPGAPISIVVKP